MVLGRVELAHFRNYAGKIFEFSEGINVITGKNASGKTNVLEAIFLLSTGGSFRARVIDEMVFFGQELGRVKGLLADQRELEVILTKGEVAGRKTHKRKYLVDEAPKRKKDFVGLLPAVIFRATSPIFSLVL